MRRSIPIVALACLTLITGCFITSGSKKINYTKILFGKGGGFTGQYDEYFLSKNGNIYQKDKATKTFTKIKSLTGKETKAVFKEIDDNKLFELGFNYPYNMSCYIEIVKDSTSNRIVWGNAKNPPPAVVTEFYDKLMGFIISTNHGIQNNSNKK